MKSPSLIKLLVANFKARSWMFVKDTSPKTVYSYFRIQGIRHHSYRAALQSQYFPKAV